MNKGYILVILSAVFLGVTSIAATAATNEMQSVSSAVEASALIHSAATQTMPNAEDELRVLKAKNAKLMEANKQLTAQNTELQQQLNAATSKGGSLVKAYCATGTQSKNTAGAANDCSSSGYTCESVSGLCRTQCTASDQCASGYTCDVPARLCVRTG